ncbi:MAG: hypothetical protein OEZ20_10405 [candidate division WOR-3 bacterium]|nr:hypothetical protein [candidate division WOR-3 bacterium]MDH5684865.1 hypothetical protein [candidate division WOR-3 bacterium]
MADTEELTKEETELLMTAAAGGGAFFDISKTDKIPGPGIIVKYKEDLYDTKDPVAVAKYYEAFKSLMNRGLVSQAGGKTYQLTGPGWEKARSLREE